MKKQKELFKALPIILALLFVASFFLVFIDYKWETTVLTVKTAYEYKVTGFNLAFGVKELEQIITLNSSVSTQMAEVNYKVVTLNLVAFICGAVALVAGVLRYFLGAKKQKDLFNIVTLAMVALFVCAAVFVFMSASSFHKVNYPDVEEMEGLKLAFGAIAAGVLAALGGCASLLSFRRK